MKRNVDGNSKLTDKLTGIEGEKGNADTEKETME